jgi:hypothetical protein
MTDPKNPNSPSQGAAFDTPKLHDTPEGKAEIQATNERITRREAEEKGATVVRVQINGGNPVLGYIHPLPGPNMRGVFKPKVFRIGPPHSDRDWEAEGILLEEIVVDNGKDPLLKITVND